MHPYTSTVIIYILDEWKALFSETRAAAEGKSRSELGVCVGEVVVHGPDRHPGGPGGGRRGQRRPPGIAELSDERLDDGLLGVLAAGLPGGAVVGPGDGHPASTTSTSLRAATVSTVPMSGGKVVTSASSCSNSSRA